MSARWLAAARSSSSPCWRSPRRSSASTWPASTATTRPGPGDRVFGPVERLDLPRSAGVDAEREQRWTGYAVSLLAFSVVSVLVLYAAAAGPGRAAAQPRRRAGRARAAVVQHRGQLRHQHQLAELRRRVDDEPPHPDGRAWRCRTSCRPPSGWRVAVALIRGLVRRRRSTRRQLLGRPHPRHRCGSCCRSSFVVALVLVSQGVIQNFSGFTEVTTVEGATQAIPGGPVASQEAIKQLGTNGGGFFNANSAHPLENPNGFTNLLEIVAAPGHPVRARRSPSGAWSRTGARAWAVLAAMVVALGRRRACRHAASRPTATPNLDRARRRPGGHRRPSPAATWRARRSASAPRARGLFAGSDHRHLDRRGQLVHDSFTAAGGARAAGAT